MNLFALLADITAVVAPVFIIAALGFGWVRAKLAFDSAFITTFAINVSTPCLAFSALTRMHLAGDAMLTMAAASVASLALAAAVAAPLLKSLSLSQRVYLPALMFPNSGNLGLPICLFAFGDAGLSYGVLFFAVMAIAQFTVGPAIAMGRPDLKMVVRTPIIYAVALAVLAQVSGVAVPRWIGNTAMLLGNCAVPLMLFSLGTALARLAEGGVRRGLALSAFRLVLGVCVGVTVSWLLGLEGTMRGVVILESAMPVAVFNYLWALRFRSGPEEVASMVLGSTAMAFVGLPLLLAVLM